MFDVQLSKHDTYKESKRFQSGKELKIAMTPWGKIGLSICYDVRFPNLYRSLASNGSIFLSIPSWLIANGEAAAICIAKCFPKSEISSLDFLVFKLSKTPILPTFFLIEEWRYEKLTDSVF